LGAESELVHGTCVALGHRAALLRGASGAGKSDLALRFLFLARRGPTAPDSPALVADDQVRLLRDGMRILASAPAPNRGMIEVRGIGIAGVKFEPEAELALVVDLVTPEAMERLPEPGLTVPVLGLQVPLTRLAPFQHSAPIKLALALAGTPRA
jgi:serine kinase of HPr protein (carbohydrate metabolism regulator)